MTAKKIASILTYAFKNNHVLFVCGNGGSASQANHFVAEFVCKFEYNRDPLPAISLCANQSNLTAIANDYGYKYVFSRQLLALAKKGDVFITLSTSGKSENCNHALGVAKEMGMVIIDFPRKGVGAAKVQEYQLKLMHDICRLVEYEFIGINDGFI